MQLSLTFIFQIVAVVIIVGIFYFFSKKGSFKVNSSVSFKKTKMRTPTLNLYSIDFTELARLGKLNPVVGREQEMLRLAQVLSRKEKNNAILVGAPGVGKTAIVEALAQRIATNDVPAVLKDKHILSLSVPSLLAGTKYRGEFEERAKKIVEEVKLANRTIILFIDEIHSVIQSQGAEGSVNFADILKPALARGDLQTIGATTTAEYEKYIKVDPSLERRFQLVEVKEPNFEETLIILKGVADKFKEFHNVEFTDAALETAIRLTEKFVKDRKLPDKAIDAIDEAAAMVRVSHIHEHLPAILYTAAVETYPDLADIWKKIQEVDKKIIASQKPAKSFLDARTALEKQLLDRGVSVVDSSEIEAVIKMWYTA